MRCALLSLPVLREIDLSHTLCQGGEECRGLLALRLEEEEGEEEANRDESLPRDIAGMLAELVANHTSLHTLKVCVCVCVHFTVLTIDHFFRSTCSLSHLGILVFLRSLFVCLALTHCPLVFPLSLSYVVGSLSGVLVICLLS